VHLFLHRKPIGALLSRCANEQEPRVFKSVSSVTRVRHAMSKSANRQSDSARGSDEQKPASGDRHGGSSTKKSKAGEQAQKDAALTQQQSPGEPAGGE